MIFFPTGEKTEAGIVAAAKHALRFVVVGTAWIIFTDIYVAANPENILSQLTHLHVFKGILFITACGVFLFYLILSHHRSMREKEEVMHTLFHHNPVPTWFLDEAQMKILAANPAACSAFGYTHSEMLNMKMTDLSGENEYQILVQTLRSCRGPVGQQIIFSFRTKTGNLIHARIFPVRSRFRGKDTCFVSMLDVSFQLKAEKELEIVNNTLKQSFEGEKEALILFNQELMYRLRQTESVNEELIYVNEELQKTNLRLAEQYKALKQGKKEDEPG